MTRDALKYIIFTAVAGFTLLIIAWNLLIPSDDPVPDVGPGSVLPDTSQFDGVGNAGGSQQGTLRQPTLFDNIQLEPTNDDGVYRIATNGDPERDSDFDIIYYMMDGSIFVSLRTEPLALARRAAEEALLRELGLSKQTLCELLIIVNTPREVSERFSGRDLGLSFCPNSVPLE